MAYQINARNEGARTRQAPGELSVPASRVEDSASADRLEPVEQKLVGIAAPQDGVLFPIRGGGFPFDM